MSKTTRGAQRTLQTMFPGTDPFVILRALADAEGDADRAAAALVAPPTPTALTLADGEAIREALAANPTAEESEVRRMVAHCAPNTVRRTLVELDLLRDSAAQPTSAHVPRADPPSDAAVWPQRTKHPARKARKTAAFDLHGYGVAEGLDAVREEIASARATGCGEISFITGHGNAHGRCPMRRAVLSMLQATHERASVCAENEGRIVVKL